MANKLSSNNKLPAELLRIASSDYKTIKLGQRLTLQTVNYQKGQDVNAAQEQAIALMKMPVNGKILEAEYMAWGTLTSNDSNYARLSITDGSTVLFTTNTKTTSGGGTGNWSNNTSYPLTCSGVTSTITDDQNLTFVIQKTGTGVVVPSGCLTLTWCEA